MRGNDPLVQRWTETAAIDGGAPVGVEEEEDGGGGLGFPRLDSFDVVAEGDEAEQMVVLDLLFACSNDGDARRRSS